MIAIILLILAQTPNPPVAQLAETASDQFTEGFYQNSAESWEQLFARMPHRGRIAYNLAAAYFMLDSHAIADSILSVEISDIAADTLSAARSITSLALSITANDYSGVEASTNDLRNIVSNGDAVQSAITALEAGLNWLDNHEPPEDQQDQSEDQQDQNEDQQDQSEDQQDQSEDQQDQSEDQQDQSEDQQDQSEDQQDQSEDQQDQSEDQQDQAPPPEIGDMSEEQAQAILDLVEDEQAPDSAGTGKMGFPSGPIW